MSRKTLEDVEILRLKLRSVNTYIEAFESRMKLLWSKTYAEVVTQDEPNPQQLLRVTRNAVKMISEIGLSKSLIQDDLEEAVKELGDEHSELVAERFRRYSAQYDGIGKSAENGCDAEEVQAEIVSLVDSAIEFVDAGLMPARQLRDRLLAELTKR